MSYEVTATRRRPQLFDDLAGQEFVAETLKNSIKSKKTAHAYLFSGPRGCGKTSTARILAKALNCQNGPTETPCGVCENCREITKGSSLDVIEIDGASNTSVENIRQIKEEVGFPPARCRYKIYIIDEVHMLSTSAFNALLKTIEEPPEYVVFIFATTELQKVPATIKSRCQQFNFRLVSIEKVKECLFEAANELGIQADDEALFWIARESTGSMRDAYTLFDQVVAFSENHITYEKIRDKLGLVGIERLNSIFESCVEGNSSKVIDILDGFFQSGISVEQLISNSCDYLRSLLFIKSGITKESLIGNSVERYSSLTLNSWSNVQIERALSVFLQLYRDVRYSVSPRFEIELAFSRLCWIKDYVSNSELKKAVESAKSLLENSQKNELKTNEQNSNNSNYENSKIENSQKENNPEFLNSKPSSRSIKVDGIEHEIPEGLPVFSVLKNEFSQNEENHTEDSGQNGEKSDPFYDGGPLPPEKSAAETKIELSDSFLKDSFSENPDDEEDDSDSFLDDEDSDFSYDENSEEIQKIYEDSIQKSQNFLKNKSNEFVETKNGQKIFLDELKGKVLAAIKAKENDFLFSRLEITKNWKLKEGKIIAPVNSEMELAMLKKNFPAISEVISGILEKQIQFEAEFIDESQNQNQIHFEIPKEVQVLVNTFRGEIVSGRR